MGEVWFAYDGECPICSYAAHTLRIRKSVGNLHLVNARESQDHPLVREITALGLNLDDGMVLKFGSRCYHGRDALHMMALLGSPIGWFNRANALLFRSRLLAKLLYPPMRGTRNLLLRLHGTQQIHNLRSGTATRPIFQDVFGDDWDKLPKVMRDHYAVRPNSNDSVTVEGTLDVNVSTLISLMSSLSGALVSKSGKNVPVTVTFRSGESSRDFYLDRTFRFPDGEQRFLSRMEHVGGNELIEFLRFGVGWKTAYNWTGEKVTLMHRGYIWRIFGLDLSVPLGLVLGMGAAEETPVSDDVFEMWTHTRHRWFGDGLAYSGSFKVTNVSCARAS